MYVILRRNRKSQVHLLDLQIRMHCCVSSVIKRRRKYFDVASFDSLRVAALRFKETLCNWAS